MSGQIDYLTGYAEDELAALSTEALAEALTHALHEIWTGIAFFPEVPFVNTWKAWFRYLLPYTIALINTNYKASGIYDLFEGGFKAFSNVYPDQIIEEYPGFRDDAVFTLGTRVIPEVLSRDYPSSTTLLQHPLFNDIWYHIDDDHEAGKYETFDLPMRFCLKYLIPAEIETWVESLLKIDSPQWRLAMITWWLQMYPEVQADVSMPEENLKTFVTAMKHHLTHEVFLVWATDIKSHQTFQYGEKTFPISSSDRELIEKSLKQFKQKFFEFGIIGARRAVPLRGIPKTSAPAR